MTDSKLFGLDPKMTGALFLISGLLIFGMLGIVYINANEDTPESGIPVTVIVDMGDGNVYTFTDLELAEATPIGALSSVSNENASLDSEIIYYPLYDSHMVETIGGRTNGDDGRYWMFYVNGEMPMEGADTYTLSEGDTVKWAFEVPQWI